MSTIKPRAVLKRTGAFAPSWSMDGVAYHVTLRLADSIPPGLLQAWAEEDAGRGEERNATRRIERELDRRHGACLFTRPRCASLVREALYAFHGERYHLHAWCLLPNHVHAVVEPFAGFGVNDFEVSLRTQSGPSIGAAIGTRSAVWHRDSSVKLLKSADSFDRAVDYLLTHPSRSGLRNWTWTSRPNEAHVRTPRWLLAG